jgi:hypothetical protein
MNREHLPCLHCARFIPDPGLRKDQHGPGYCEGDERPAHSTDQPCVLFNRQGSWETRKAQMPPVIRSRETISRTSATIPAKAGTRTTTTGEPEPCNR